MENFFNNCNNISMGKKLYHKLMMKYHPDHGGDIELTKEINRQYFEFCHSVISKSFDDNRKASENFDSYVFSEILAKISNLNIDIEIIGFWIYAFNSYAVKDFLHELGFWFSSSHKAWVYSGGKKKYYKTKNTTDQIRKEKGSEIIKERDENSTKIA